MPGEESADAFELLLGEADPAAVAADEGDAPLPTEPVAGVVAENRTGRRRSDDPEDVEPA